MRCISQAVCIVALVGCGQKAAQPEVAKETAIPEAGLPRYPQSVNPGDPMNAVKDFKRIYWAMYEYRKKYKKLPLPHVLQDTSKELLPGVKLEPEDFENPDVQYSEYEPGQKPQPPYIFAYYPLPDLPPDSPLLKQTSETNRYKPIFPLKGEKVAWAATRIYTRSNARTLPGGRTTFHYSGVQIVLWSDGTIDKVPESKMLMEAAGSNMWYSYYPGHARLSKNVFPRSKWWEDRNAEEKRPYITWEDGGEIQRMSD